MEDVNSCLPSLAIYRVRERMQRRIHRHSTADAVREDKAREMRGVPDAFDLRDAVLGDPRQRRDHLEGEREGRKQKQSVQRVCVGALFLSFHCASRLSRTNCEVSSPSTPPHAADSSIKQYGKADDGGKTNTNN